MSTTKKYRKFVEEPMGYKRVTELPGIGEVLGGRLTYAGYTHAYMVYDEFLLMKRDEEAFMAWLKQICNANRKQQFDCCSSLNEWYYNFENRSTTKKHGQFVAKPMGNKRVTEFPGIGEVLGAGLADASFTRADCLSRLQTWSSRSGSSPKPPVTAARDNDTSPALFRGAVGGAAALAAFEWTHYHHHHHYHHHRRPEWTQDEGEKEVKKVDASLLRKLLRDKLTSSKTDTEWTQDEEEKEVKKEDTSLQQKLLRDKLTSSKKDTEVLPKDPTSPLRSVKSFGALNLKPELLKGVYEMGFNAPSKTQETALPTLLAEPPVSMIAQSQNGTDETATFVLTMLSRVDVTRDYPQCLCLAPTRELVLQIGEVTGKMSKHMTGLRIRYATRGERVSRGEAVSDHIIIGTPGTVMDWSHRYKALRLEALKVFVLDEADVMISMQGLQDHCTRIQKKLNTKCQRLLFSATFHQSVMQFALKIVPSRHAIIRRRRVETSVDIKHRTQ